MNRLTKDMDTQYDLVGKYNSNVEEFTLNHKLRNDLLNKLGQLEDLEEEIGCPLEVVFKAIEDGIVIIGDINQYGNMTLWLANKPLEALVGEKLDFEEPRLIKYNEWCFSCDGGSYRGCVRLKDYTKSWWLKEDRSE